MTSYHNMIPLCPTEWLWHQTLFFKTWLSIKAINHFNEVVYHLNQGNIYIYILKWGFFSLLELLYGLDNCYPFMTGWSLRFVSWWSRFVVRTVRLCPTLLEATGVGEIFQVAVALMGDIIDGIEKWNIGVIWKLCFSEYDIDDMNWWGMNGKLMGY